MTVNEAMVLQKALRSRIGSLSSIRNANAVRTRRWDMFSDGKEKERTEIEPQYDPKVVDKKITELEVVLFKLDTAIKQSNAVTKIDFEADVSKLLEPLA
jgi:hypothetical protein